MRYEVEILIGPKEGILNPEATAIKNALEKSLGFHGINALDFRRSLSFSYESKQETEELARRETERLCELYFADLSVNETYKIVSVREIKD